MRDSVLIVTYHGIERSAGPLSVSPALLCEHLDRLAAAGISTLTIAEVRDGLRAGSLPQRAVALTFDDAFASIAEQAAPLLAERGQRATVFVVAGAIGGTNSWPTQPPGAPRRSLASLAELRALAAAGWEVGSHGMEHAPLSHVTRAEARRELVDSRLALEQALQVEVSSYAMPYGAHPGAMARELLRGTYGAACTTRLGKVTRSTSLWAMPRVDAHYLRRPELLARAAGGTAGAYLRVRGLAARARRTLRKDYVAARG